MAVVSLITGRVNLIHYAAYLPDSNAGLIDAILILIDSDLITIHRNLKLICDSFIIICGIAELH